MADDRFRHVGFEPQIAGVLHFQQRLARRGKVAHVGIFAGDDAVERRDDLGVAQQGFRLRRRRVGHAEFGLGVVVLGLRKDFLLKQVGGAFQIVLRLLAHRQRPVELGLHFARVQLHQQFARCHVLAGHHQHFFNPAADFGFDDGMQSGAHRAHHLLGGDALFALNGLHPDGGRRKVSEPAGDSGARPQPATSRPATAMPASPETKRVFIKIHFRPGAAPGSGTDGSPKSLMARL